MTQLQSSHGSKIGSVGRVTCSDPIKIVSPCLVVTIGISSASEPSLEYQRVQRAAVSFFFAFINPEPRAILNSLISIIPLTAERN